MAVRIRLRRTGKRNEPTHRVVVADARSPRDGRFIENIGIYDPRNEVERVDLERADYWLSKGAQPSDTVRAIIQRVRAGVPLGGGKRAGDEKEVKEDEGPTPETEDAPETDAEPESAE